MDETNIDEKHSQKLKVIHNVEKEGVYFVMFLYEVITNLNQDQDIFDLHHGERRRILRDRVSEHMDHARKEYNKDLGIRDPW